MKRCTLAFLLVALWVVPATAQVTDEAFSHFEAGAKLYAAEDYRAAIAEFRQGYEVQDHPMFQVNIALAHWRLGELLDAIAAADLASVEAEALGEKIATENAARRSTFSVLRVSRERTEVIAADIAAAAEQLPDVVVTEPAPKRRSRISGLGWAGVATAGAGVAVLGGWAAAEAGLSDDRQRLERAGEEGDRVAFDELGDAFRRKQSTARILLASGLGLVAVGSGLFVFDLVRPRGETHVGLRLSGAPGVVITHRF